MSELLRHRTARHELANRLIAEYAGAVAPGQVLACVLRSDRALATSRPKGPERLALCEELVRRHLVEQVASSSRVLVGHTA